MKKSILVVVVVVGLCMAGLFAATFNKAAGARGNGTKEKVSRERRSNQRRHKGDDDDNPLESRSTPDKAGKSLNPRNSDDKDLDSGLFEQNNPAEGAIDPDGKNED